MSETAGPRIKIITDGPYIVTGAPVHRVSPVEDADGRPVDWSQGKTLEGGERASLCRCGGSANKPFCDGSHKSNGFDGTETAPTASERERREVHTGQGVEMTDDRSLCVFAGYCARQDTTAWKLVKQPDDIQDKELLVRLVLDCPSGRLEYALTPGGEPVEENLPHEVAVVDDGPLWARGGIPVVGADGKEYAVRNRQTLCRCGASENKPFCDGSHTKTDFSDS